MRITNIKNRSRSLLILLVWSINTQAGDIQNYCHDPKTNSNWQEIKSRASDEFKIINLANIRDALCQQVDDGSLIIEEATALFESERERVNK